MRFGTVVRLLVACLCLAAGPADACDVGAATAAINVIAGDLVARKVQRIDLLKISDRLLASIPVSPDHFASYAQARSTLVLTERDAADLAAAVRTLAPAAIDYQPDLRWRLVLLDDTGKTLHSIFFAKRYVQGRGRSGYVDGDMCGFGAAAMGSPALVKWLQKRL